ncbi:MAG TPA: HAMP domain-containing sensor histidine kinase [Candidatus Saccharimonadales bacterium]|nr:HAMP domain-containing sensor histidine kinase [Candidatus Saccharimonadales bacterium]
MGKPKTGVSQLFKPHSDGILVATSLKITLIMVTALTVGFSASFIVNDMYRSYLSSRVASVAAAWPAEVSDQAAQRRLNRIKTTYDGASQVYLVKPTDSGGYNRIDADGQTKQPASIYLISQLYNLTGPAIKGPLSNHWQKHVITTSAVVDPITGQAVALIGIDVLSSTYVLVVALAIIIPLIAGLMISLIVVAADRIRLRRREALRFRSELVSIASHELRTPLTGLRWSEEGLLKASLAKTYHQTIKTMYDSTLRLQESIEDILQLANLQAGRNLGLNKTSTDLTELLNSIMTIQKLPAEQKNLTLTFADDWPKRLMINCDAQRMKRVFNNLVSNAIKYSQPGTEILLDHEKLGDKHLISLIDQGIGIPEMEQSKVFSGFYRATNAVKHQSNGTGMGLYLSRQVIEQHDGKLWLKSKVNQGTTVYIELP